MSNLIKMVMKQFKNEETPVAITTEVSIKSAQPNKAMRNLTCKV